jgi:hypothetical protein
MEMLTNMHPMYKINNHEKAYITYFDDRRPCLV